MPNYRRSHTGTTLFFTLVTNRRRKIFAHEPCRRMLGEVIRETQRRYPFTIDALVLLPEHLHCIWSLPDEDGDYSRRWSIIKRRFTQEINVLCNNLYNGGGHGVDTGGHGPPYMGGGSVGGHGPPYAGGTDVAGVGWAAPTNTNGGSAMNVANVGWAMPTNTKNELLRLAMDIKTQLSRSRIHKREGGIWQRRFWEHTIRDAYDLTTHVEYIHYNPVKHGLVQRARDWEFSSFHRYCAEGKYPLDWGCGESPVFKDDWFGE